MNLKFDFSEFDFSRFLIQMLQVCNFNFVLIILLLLPKNEFIKQYMIYFSGFAALTTLISLPSGFGNLKWYDINIMNSLLNHVFAATIPLLLVVSHRTKPKKEYILPCSLMVFGYFTIVYLISGLLIDNGILMPENSFSFIYDRGKTAIFKWFYNILPYDYFYLYLLFPFVVIFFIVLSRLFKNYKIKDVL